MIQTEFHETAEIAPEIVVCMIWAGEDNFSTGESKEAIGPISQPLDLNIVR
jgi:hypothetical protein